VGSGGLPSFYWRRGRSGSCPWSHVGVAGLGASPWTPGGEAGSGASRFSGVVVCLGSSLSPGGVAGLGVLSFVFWRCDGFGGPFSIPWRRGRFGGHVLTVLGAWWFCGTRQIP